MGWRTIERPGYFGKKRDELFFKWNEQFGASNWRIMYEWGSLIILKKEAIQIYEDGYYEFLKSNPNTLKWLVSNASDIYDTAPSNIESIFDYENQETPNNHIHDVAIRRCVMRLGEWFMGNHLMQVRGPGTEGELLSPYLIPFHFPHKISKENIKDYGGKGEWWREIGIENNVEEFYQRNKLLQIRCSI